MGAMLTGVGEYIYAILNTFAKYSKNTQYSAIGNGSPNIVPIR